ncbi:MAG: GNAT family N-acetyltransferase [Oscillospiraceae bacterium]|nr:GNAT family N-acetyltransferase [Oscillospiraceae bacterium]
MLAPFDITGIRIETQRLILRPWTMDDLDDFYAYASIDGLGQMAGWTPHRSLEESEFILNLFMQGKKTFAIELKETGQVIGSLGIEEPDPDPEKEKLGREIGYALHKDYWGNGLMPEAVRAVISYCFDTLRFDFLTCSHFDWNGQSKRVIEKCGFRYFSTTRTETRCDTVENSMNYILYRI